MGLFDFFRKKLPEPSQAIAPVMNDVNSIPLEEGDVVEALRYDLGKCRIIRNEKGFAYQSLETGETVGWLRMVDAITGMQKVRKVAK